MVCNDCFNAFINRSRKKKLLYFWVIILCLLTFILSVTGTFLVRSGILNSVHTFANDPQEDLYTYFFKLNDFCFSFTFI